MWLQISSGDQHTCGIASDQKAYYWGRNTYGQLGIGTSGSGTDKSVPTAVRNNVGDALYGKTIKSISAGQDHTCAIASDNLVYCWSNDDSGQLGDDVTLALKNVPTAVYNLSDGVLCNKTIKSIQVNERFTCLIASDDKVYCWGRDMYGQLGDGSTGTYRTRPVAVIGELSSKTVLSLAKGGEHHTCAITSDYKTYCWGRSPYGQVGNGGTGTYSTPVNITSSGLLNRKIVKSIWAGRYQSCAIDTNNQGYCWGNNTRGQIFDNNYPNNALLPVSIYTLWCIKREDYEILFWWLLSCMCNRIG